LWLGQATATQGYIGIAWLELTFTHCLWPCIFPPGPFYGAVGRATQEGIGFLPIYLGPLLVFVFAAPLLRRIIHISKRNSSTSIADFIASRYGKSQLLAAMIAAFALIGSVPYIALQLKAIAMGFAVLSSPQGGVQELSNAAWSDSAWYITLALALLPFIWYPHLGINRTSPRHGFKPLRLNL